MKVGLPEEKLEDSANGHLKRAATSRRRMFEREERAAVFPTVSVDKGLSQ